MTITYSFSIGYEAALKYINDQNKDHKKDKDIVNADKNYLKKTVQKTHFCLCQWTETWFYSLAQCKHTKVSTIRLHHQSIIKDVIYQKEIIQGLINVEGKSKYIYENFTTSNPL